jgi:hypothetical protein
MSQRLRRASSATAITTGAALLLPGRMVILGGGRRALARKGAVTLDANAVVLPVP